MEPIQDAEHIGGRGQQTATPTSTLEGCSFAGDAGDDTAGQQTSVVRGDVTTSYTYAGVGGYVGGFVWGATDYWTGYEE